MIIFEFLLYIFLISIPIVIIQLGMVYCGIPSLIALLLNSGFFGLAIFMIIEILETKLITSKWPNLFGEYKKNSIKTSIKIVKIVIKYLCSILILTGVLLVKNKIISLLPISIGVFIFHYSEKLEGKIKRIYQLSSIMIIISGLFIVCLFH